MASETRNDQGGIDPTKSISLVRGQTVTIPVTVSNTGVAPAYLSAWVDLYGDHSFTDQGDEVANDIVVAANIASATEAGTTVTITTAAAESFAVGEQITITGVGTGYNGTFTIVSAPSSTSFTYTAAAGLAAAGAGGVAALSTVPLAVSVPSNVNAGRVQTWLRLRLSTQPGLTASGGMPANQTVGPAIAEPDGEVEDFNNVVVVPPPVIVSGRVYSDANSDGTFDAGDSGLAGWTVFLDVLGTGVAGYDPTKDPNTTTLSSADPSIAGTYNLTVDFGNALVTAGKTYNLYEIPPMGRRRTTRSLSPSPPLIPITGTIPSRSTWARTPPATTSATTCRRRSS